jgi:hypothetical protein
MATLADIIDDPNYVNANAATKKAIFDRYAPQDPNYTQANAATQEAIRIKFGVAQPRAAEPEGMPGPRGEPPAWAKDHPGLYRGVVSIRQVLGPVAEMLGGAGGALLGGTGGTFGAGPVGTVTGAMVGAGLGYGAVKSGLRAADVALGLAPPDTLAGEALKTAGDVLEGSTFEVGGRLATPVVNYLARKGASIAGSAMDIGQMPNQLAASMARESLGTPERVAAARAALQAAGTEGLTAQQALARGGVIAPSAQATIERAIKTTTAVDTRAAIEASQEAARQSTIKNVTPDLQAAINARRTASKPLYEAADRAVVPIDSALTDVISRMPKGTLAAAAQIATMEGRPFVMGATTSARMVETGILDASGKPVMREVPGQMAEITGESLHYIKRALSDIAYGPTATTNVGRDTQLAARKLLDDYISVFEAKVPQYAQARRVFSDMSAPVNQAQVLKEMVSVLEKPGGGERIGPFLNVLGRGEEAMLRRAGGRGAPRFESLSEVLTPEQIAAVRGVARQLEAQTAVKTQVSAGERRATELIKDELPNYRLPNVFNVLATTANKVLETLGAKIGKKTVERLAEASLTAKSFDELLATLPGNERSAVLKAISDPDTWNAIRPSAGAAIMGISGVVENPSMPAPTNNLAPVAAPANAFAR